MSTNELGTGSGHFHLTAFWVSEVLGGKRRLTPAMIRRLSEGLGIPAALLVGEETPGPGTAPGDGSSPGGNLSTFARIFAMFIRPVDGFDNLARLETGG